MKRPIILILAVLSLLAFLSGCADDKANIYPFSGESELIVINDGYILLSADLEEFIGGKLSFKGEELTGVRDYTTEFYFYLDSDKTVINSNIVSIDGSEDGIGISPDLGTVSAKKMFSAKVCNTIMEPEALRFSLRGTRINGEPFIYDLILNVYKRTN